MLVFLKLVARLQNDENDQCLQFIAISLRKLFTSITASSFNDLYSATNDWLYSRKPSIRILACRVFTQFVLSNTPHFTKHLLMKIIQKIYNEFCIDPSSFSSNFFLAVAENLPEDLFKGIFQHNESKLKLKGKGLITTLKKRKSKHINIEDDENKKFKYSLRLFNFFDNLKYCLLSFKQNTQSQLSECLKLSITSAKFLNTLIGHQHIREKLIPILKNYFIKNRKTDDEIKNDFSNKTLLYSLCTSLVLILENSSIKDKELRPKMIENKTIKSEENNLVKDDDLNLEKKFNEEETLLDQEEINKKRIDIWDNTLADLDIHLLTHLMLALDIDKQFGIICKRLSRICWIEIIREKGNTKKRLCILKMIGVLVLKYNVDTEQFKHLCNYFLPLIYREMNYSSETSEEKSIKDMQLLAFELGNIFQKQLGDKEFSTLLSKCQREKDRRKQKRTEQAKAMLILDPAAAIIAKQKRHLRKRTAKGRRLDELKPYRAFKRRRKEEALLRVESEKL